MRKFPLLILLGLTHLASAEIPRFIAEKAQDVIVPMLFADPTGSNRVAGQLYYNLSSNRFKAIDNSGNAVVFATGPQINSITAGTGLIGGGSSGNVQLSVDVGTTSDKIVQLDSLGRLPAVDGSQLTNLNVTFPSTFSQDLLPGSNSIVDRGVASPIGNAAIDVGGNRSQVLTQYTASVNSSVYAIKINLTGVGGGELFKVFIHEDNAGAVGALVGQSDWLPGGVLSGIVSLPFSPAVNLTGGTTYWIIFASVYGTSVGSSFELKYSAASQGFPGLTNGIGGVAPAPGFAFALESNTLNLGGPSNYWGITYTNDLHLGNGGITAPSAISMNAVYLRLPTGTSDPSAPAGSVYYNSTTNKLRLFDGTSWVDLN